MRTSLGLRYFISHGRPALAYVPLAHQPLPQRQHAARIAALEIPSLPPTSCAARLDAVTSNLLGANFLMYRKSKESLLVSCIQKILASLSSILFLIAFHLVLSLMPRTFWHKIFQARLFIITVDRKRRVAYGGAATIQEQEQGQKHHKRKYRYIKT